MKKFLDRIKERYFSKPESQKQVEYTTSSVYIPQNYQNVISILNKQRKIINEAVDEYKSKGKKIKRKMKRFITNTLKANEIPPKLMLSIDFGKDIPVNKTVEIESFTHQAYIAFDNFKKWAPPKMNVMLNIPNGLEQKVDKTYKLFKFPKEELEKTINSYIGRQLKKY